MSVISTPEFELYFQQASQTRHGKPDVSAGSAPCKGILPRVVPVGDEPTFLYLQGSPGWCNNQIDMSRLATQNNQM